MAETVRLPSIAIVWGSGDRLNPPMLPAPSLDGAAAEREPNTTNAPFSPPVRDATSGVRAGRHPGRPAGRAAGDASGNAIGATSDDVKVTSSDSSSNNRIVDNDSGAGRNARLEVDVFSTGRFYIAVWENGDDATGTYTVQATILGRPE